MRVSSRSHVSADEAVGFLKEVFGWQSFCRADLGILLGMVLSQSSEGLRLGFGLALEVVSATDCWLLCRDSAVGVAVKVINAPDGARIFQMKDLGGGRRCGWWGAEAA